MAEGVLDTLLKMELLFKRREKRQAVGREEYQIAIKIVEIWYMMICNIEKNGKKISNSYIRKQERIQAMLSYIHNEYMHPMCLADISQAGMSVLENAAEDLRKLSAKAQTVSGRIPHIEKQRVAKRDGTIGNGSFRGGWIQQCEPFHSMF